MCPVDFKSKDSHEIGVSALIERHVKYKHGIEDWCWKSDSVGGFCRACFERVPPGGVLAHWEQHHDLLSFAPFDHCIDPFTRAPNRQLVRSL
jgi:hypothetical protein